MMLRSLFRDLLQGGLPHQSQLQKSYEKTRLCIFLELRAGAQLRVLFVMAGMMSVLLRIRASMLGA